MPASRTTSPVLPWRTPKASGLRSEIVLESGDLLASADPFVPLDDSGRYARVLLCRFVAGEQTLRYFALKLQKSVYRPLGKMRVQSAISNPQIDQMWQVESDNLRNAAGDHVQRPVDLGEGSASPPVTFCKKVRTYFNPPCPKTRELLRTCTGDRALLDAGLHPWSSSTERYLVSPAVPQAGDGPTTFYRFVPAPGEQTRGDAVVRVGAELFRDFGQIVHADLETHERQELTARFPCLTCEHRAECYPQGAGPDDEVPAESRLVALSYYDFRYLAVEADELHFGDLADLVGGAPISVVSRRADGSSSRGRLTLLEGCLPPRAGRSAWMFRDDATRFPLEVLRLKLTAFAQLCGGLQAFHRGVGGAHLGVGGASAMVALPAARSGLPAHWLFDVRLGQLGSAMTWREERATPDAGVELPVPVPDAEPAYQSPMVSQSAFGEEYSMQVTVVRAVPAEDRMQLRMEARLPAGSRLAGFRDGDAVRLTTHGAVAGRPFLQLWAGIEQKSDDLLRFTAELEDAGSPSDWQTPLSFDASLAFYRRFGLPCDLYGLGMLLLRALVCHDRQGLDTVAVAAQAVLEKLVVNLDVRRDGVVDADEARRALLVEIARDKADPFGPENLLYTAADRETHPEPVPDDLWSDVLVLAFRLLSTVPGFSLCRDHADFDRGNPAGLVGRVADEVRQLIERIDIEMFDRDRRDQEIEALCGEILAEVAGGID